MDLPLPSISCAGFRCAGAEPAGGLVVLDAGLEDGVFFFVFLGEFSGQGQAVIRRRHISRDDGPGMRASSAGRSCRASSATASLSGGRASFTYPNPERTSRRARVFGVPVGRLGDLGPGGLGFVGPFEVVQVFADVFVILRVVAASCCGLAIEVECLVGRARPA